VILQPRRIFAEPNQEVEMSPLAHDADSLLRIADVAVGQLKERLKNLGSPKGIARTYVEGIDLDVWNHRVRILKPLILFIEDKSRTLSRWKLTVDEAETQALSGGWIHQIRAELDFDPIFEQHDEALEEVLNSGSQEIGPLYEAGYNACKQAHGASLAELDATIGISDDVRIQDVLKEAIRVTLMYLAVLAIPAKRDLVAATAIERAASKMNLGKNLDALDEYDQIVELLELSDLQQAEYVCKQVWQNWILRFGHEKGVVSDIDGLRYVQELFSKPDNPILGINLMKCRPAGEASPQPAGEALLQPDGEASPRSAVPIEHYGQNDPTLGGEFSEEPLDPDIRERAEKELAEVRENIRRAQEAGDIQRVTELKAKERILMEALEADRRARRNQGRPVLPNDEEKARQTVWKAIKLVREKLKTGNPPMPGLAAYIKLTIKSEGKSFAYRPDAPAPAWKF
jgi:hypothetical protein